MYGLLTKCEVKMAGYWPSSFIACLWTETKSRSINSQKRTRPISSHLDRTNLVNKGFIIWLLVKFCLRDTAGSPEWARWLHLARSGSQSQRTIWFILPAHGACHIINRHISSFANLLMLKTPRAIHQLLHGKPFAWYTYEKFAYLCAFCWPLSCFEMISLHQF